jgi:hypothetical protein
MSGLGRSGHSISFQMPSYTELVLLTSDHLLRAYQRRNAIKSSRRNIQSKIRQTIKSRVTKTRLFIQLSKDQIFAAISLARVDTPSRIFSGGTVTKLRRKVFFSGSFA